MIDFKSRRFENSFPLDNLHNRELLGSYSVRIREDLSNLKDNRFYLGMHLIELWRSQIYSLTFSRNLYSLYRMPVNVGNCCAECFFEYCYNEFGLDSSQVSRYMNIVDEFGDAQRGFQERWKDFSYSQLCELLPLTAEQRKPVKPNWTIRQIREYKKSLTAPVKPSGEAETPEEPPQTKYSRFDKWARIELCDKIFDLEEEYAELLRQYEQLKIEV